MRGDHVNKAALLRRGCKIDAALQHAAAVAMGGDVHGVRCGCIVHELAVLWAQSLEAALDDMVAVQIADQGDHPFAQSIGHQRHLFSSRS